MALRPAAVEDPRRQHVAPCVERRGERQQERIVQLLGTLQARQRYPQHREQHGDARRPQQGHAADRQCLGLGQRVLHDCLAFSIRRNATTMIVNTTTSTTNAIDDADPRRKN